MRGAHLFKTVRAELVDFEVSEQYNKHVPKPSTQGEGYQGVPFSGEDAF